MPVKIEVYPLSCNTYIYTTAQYFTNGIISQLENLSYNYPNPIVEQELSRAP
jgi:hypothetical protein